MTTHPAALADHAAVAVHDLTLHARPAITELTIADLYAITGALTDLSAALPQTLRQLATYPLIDQQPCVAANLHHASRTATDLSTLLQAIHQALGDLAETTHTQPRGSIFNRR